MALDALTLDNFFLAEIRLRRINIKGEEVVVLPFFYTFCSPRGEQATSTLNYKKVQIKQ